MRDANGRELQMGDRVQVIAQRMRDQPTGVVIRMADTFIDMQSADAMVRSMWPVNVVIVDDDLSMDVGL